MQRFYPDFRQSFSFDGWALAQGGSHMAKNRVWLEIGNKLTEGGLVADAHGRLAPRGGRLSSASHQRDWSLRAGEHFGAEYAYQCFVSPKL